jgi:hypothetical protein
LKKRPAIIGTDVGKRDYFRHEASLAADDDKMFVGELTQGHQQADAGQPAGHPGHKTDDPGQEPQGEEPEGQNKDGRNEQRDGQCVVHEADEPTCRIHANGRWYRKANCQSARFPRFVFKSEIKNRDDDGCMQRNEHHRHDSWKIGKRYPPQFEKRNDNYHEGWKQPIAEEQ